MKILIEPKHSQLFTKSFEWQVKMKPPITWRLYINLTLEWKQHSRQKTICNQNPDYIVP